MKLMIVGSRGIKDCDLKPYVAENVDLIISGGARGVDSLAENFADKNGISKLILRPDYKRYKRAAPLKRNEAMVNLADEIIVIWDVASKGTAYTIKYAKKAGKPVAVINYPTKNE